MDALPEGRVLASGPARTYQAAVYGPTERLVTLPDGSVAHIDGFTTSHGLVPGDAKFVSSPMSSFYIPESSSSPQLSAFATEKMGLALTRLEDTRHAMGADVVAVVTNDARSAHVWEARMRALGINGYARIHP